MTSHQCRFSSALPNSSALNCQINITLVKYQDEIIWKEILFLYPFNSVLPNWVTYHSLSCIYRGLSNHHTLLGSLWCDVMRCDVIWCDVIWYDVMWVMWCDWCDVMRFDVMWCEWCGWCDVVWVMWRGVMWYELRLRCDVIMWFNALSGNKSLIYKVFVCFDM